MEEITKTTTQHEITNGGFFSEAEEMVDFLQQKFGDHKNHSYFVKLIDANYVNQVLHNAKLKVFHTNEGSSTFQVILFEPHSNILKAVKRLCICNQCKDLFELYQLNVDLLKETILRSSIKRDTITSVGSYVNNFLQVNSVCAVAADKKSYETVWFVKIIEEVTADKEIWDDYGVTVIEGETVLKALFLEKSSQTKTGQTSKLTSNKTTLLYKESVVYPFVNFKKGSDNYFISNNNFYEIISYVEHFGLTIINIIGNTVLFK